MMTSRRKVELAEQAEDLSECYWRNESLSLESVADQNGISHCYGYYEDYFAGLIACRNHEFNIFLNLDILKKPHYTRTRSTFAHELGHYFINDHQQLLRSGLSLSLKDLNSLRALNEIEQEANHFAAHLLMPQSRFNQKAHTLPSGMGQVLGLSDYFNTSKTTTAYHLVNSDICPIVVVKQSADGQPTFSVSKSFRSRFKPGRLMVDANRNVADSHIVTGHSEKINFRQGVSGLSSWSTWIRQGTNRDIPLIEQTMTLGAFGQMTVLVPADCI